MSEVSAAPVVTQVDGHWQGTWDDGYALRVNTYDASRPGVFRAELDVFYQDTYITALGVDFLHARSQEEVCVALGARNSVTPIVWDDRLGHFYRLLRQRVALSTPGMRRVVLQT